MSGEREGGQGEAAGAGERPADEDVRIDAFVEVIDDPVEIRRRGAAMSSDEEAEYLARAEEDEDYRAEAEDELERWRQDGVDVDGAREGLAAGNEDGSPDRPGLPNKRRVRVPAGRESAEPARAPEGGTERRSAPATFPEGGEVGTERRPAPAAPPEREVRFPPPGDPAGGIGETPEKSAGGLDEARMLELTDVLSGGMRLFGAAVDKGIDDIKREMPRFRDGELGELGASVKRLEELLRLQKSDGERRREVGKRWWRWPLRVLAVAVLVGTFAGGVAVQVRWPVVDDGTNGWKDIVWERHGMKIAECMDRADKRGSGANCGVSAQVR